MLYGAVIMGDIWRFGKLDRTIQQITQDINLFKVITTVSVFNIRYWLGIALKILSPLCTQSSFTKISRLNFDSWFRFIFRKQGRNCLLNLKLRKS